MGAMRDTLSPVAALPVEALLAGASRALSGRCGCSWRLLVDAVKAFGLRLSRSSWNLRWRSPA